MAQAFSLCLAFSTLGAAPIPYEIRPAPQNRFVLEVFKTGLMSGKKHTFEFERYSGAVSFDREAPQNSRVELSIEGASAVCKDTWVSQKDLAKIQKAALEDMLDVAHHPRLTFTSTRVIPRGPDRYDVEGALTIRGIAKPAVVHVTAAPATDQSLALAGTAEVRLRDYGLKPPGAALGAIGTRNEMNVEFSLTAVRAR